MGIEDSDMGLSSYGPIQASLPEHQHLEITLDYVSQVKPLFLGSI